MSEETAIESDYLWILCDDKKWCISKNSLIEMFDRTPICLSIIESITTQKSTNEFSYRLIHISPEYVDNLIKLLRRELSIFSNFNLLPKIHYDFFGIDIVRENIIKNFFTNIRDIVHMINLYSSRNKKINVPESGVLDYSQNDIEYDLLGNKLSLIKLLNPMNIYSSKNQDTIYFKYSPDNSQIDILIKLLIMIDGLNEVFNKTFKNDYEMKDIEYYIKLNHFKINIYDFHDLKMYYSDETKIMNHGRPRNLFYDLDSFCYSITYEIIFYMNLLAKLFGESIIIDESWLNKTFIDYKNASNDDIQERRKRYVQKVKNIIDEFDDFFNVFDNINKSYGDYLSNF
tara:strand:+ start:2121 stop:3149 length:1029 start_codon:yes stop_codon:yes gene_type:complete